MTEAVTHQMIMLRPMQAGLSGYARVQSESRRQLLQVHLRGMQHKEMRVFWYAEERMVREVGRANANNRGEASLSAELPMDIAAPRRLVALLITDGGQHPRPLAIGLCTAQSAGSLMDAKNALLTLCERLEREETAERCTGHSNDASGRDEKETRLMAKSGSARNAAGNGTSSPANNGPKELPENAGRQCTTAVSAHKSAAVPAFNDGWKQPSLPPLPREVFLPAIEARRRPERRRRRESPAPILTQAGTAYPSTPDGQPESVPDGNPVSSCRNSAEPAPTGSTQPPFHRKSVVGQPPADALPTLQWPGLFASLAAYFDRYPPTGLMNWPGWRFVHVPEGRHGLWIGYHQQDGRILDIAYALPMDAPAPAGQPFHPVRTATGHTVQLLTLKA